MGVKNAVEAEAYRGYFKDLPARWLGTRVRLVTMINRALTARRNCSREAVQRQTNKSSGAGDGAVLAT